MALADINIEERKKWDLRPGNTVKVWLKIKEGEKTRLQAFEGLIIAHKHGFESGATFTVRKISGGIGVERIFPVFSPNIDKIEILKRSKARRAKLYYIREKTAKQIRRKMKQLRETFSKKEVEEKKEEVAVAEAEEAVKATEAEENNNAIVSEQPVVENAPQAEGIEVEEIKTETEDKKEDA